MQANSTPDFASAPGRSVRAVASAIGALLERGEPAEALAQATTVFEKHPERVELLHLVSAAHRAAGKLPQALAVLDRLAAERPDYGRADEERGLCLLAAGDAPAAVAAFTRAVRSNDTLERGWRELARLRQASGDGAGAQVAQSSLARLRSLPGPVVLASDLLNDGFTREAEEDIRAYLRQHGDDVDAMRLLAQIAMRLEILDDAELLLAEVVRRSPGYLDARFEYASVLWRRRRILRAWQQTNALLAIEPDNRTFLMLHAHVCDAMGRTEEALGVYERLERGQPDDPEAIMGKGQVLRALGRRSDALAAFHRAADMPLGFGSACLSLANMKTYRFSDEEVARMTAALAEPLLRSEESIPLNFALGKALEDRGQYEQAFWRLSEGNRLKRLASRSDPDAMERTMRSQESVFTREFFDRFGQVGCKRPDPIFILGMPRAGSTLIEQILASHSQVDGTAELPEIPRLVHQFRNRSGDDAAPRYPRSLAELPPGALEDLGLEYLEETAVYRRGRPFFTDKMPGNFRDIGFIRLILPNARIIDARREPMACCFGNFKQLFAKGQDFAYSLEDLGRYYRNYVRLMDHWQRVFPGKILTVRHEDVVRDLEGSVRRILDYCALPFEQPCLEFHKTERLVRTVSSEQVRRPIDSSSTEGWRRYERWLAPLREALGIPP